MRRGSTLLQVVGGLFVAGLVLSMAVPLYLAAVRRADAGILQSRMREQARRLAGRLREDVRRARTVRLAGDGSGMRLELPRPGGGTDHVSYRFESGTLVRDLRGRVPERDVYAAPLVGARFTRSGAGVRAQFFFDQTLYGRRLALSADCVAVPRSAL